MNYAFEQLRPVEHLLHVLYITPDALWSVYCLLKLQALETNHEISPGGVGGGGVISHFDLIFGDISRILDRGVPRRFVNRNPI